MSALQIIGDLPTHKAERLRIALDRYAGVNLLDIRLTVEIAAGTNLRAGTARGVSVRVDMLPEIIAGLQKAEAMAREQGLMEAQP